MQKLVYILFLLFVSLPLSAQSGIIKVSNGKVVEGEFFPKQAGLIEEYIEKNKIDINQKNDAESLFKFVLNN